MPARLALGWLAVSMLCAACATTGATSGTTGTAAAPHAATAVASPAPAAGSAAAPGAAPVGAGPTPVVASGGSADPGLPASTPAEQRAALDSRLDASLQSFDKRLHAEQQQSAAGRDAQAKADATAVDSVDPMAARDADRRTGRDEIHRDRSGDLQAVGVQQDASAGQQTTGGNGVDAKPIPSGADDDIVARRLRQAAENETDPELKEKLWKEYRDYKENTKGST